MFFYSPLEDRRLIGSRNERIGFKCGEESRYLLSPIRLSCCHVTFVSQGLVKYTVYGTLLVTLGHLTWPLFRCVMTEEFRNLVA